MSRVDEALKRAAAGTADLRREPADTDRATVLEEYPREGRLAVAEDPVASFAREEPATVAPFMREDNASRQVAELVPRRTVAVRAVPRPQPQPRPATEGLDRKLVLAPDASPILVEQYRRLAASIHELQREQGLKTLMVTSAVPREGKSLTVSNLALTLSESYGRRVLLIDADLRRPSLHELFGLPNTAGLSDVLRSERTDLPLLSVTPLMSVLPAGPPDSNPVAGITSDRMRALLREASAEFDWVLLDAPPVAVMPDASLLGTMTRAVVLVIAAGSTDYAQVGRAIDELGRECIVGTVLNQIDEKDIPDTSFYRAYYEPAPTR